MATFRDLEDLVDEIVDYRIEIKILEKKIEYKKTQMIKDMTALKVNRVITEMGVAEKVDYEIATVCNDLVNEALKQARENGTEYTVDDCKQVKRLNYLLVKKNRGV
ncbi:hypothetical protein [Clostridium perfringens]|uniref:hypothetical protein n=1 Tax=Clostridium perfringens TaxID=1502 RepID=UPI00232E18E5|nr:hypothetical protein [Clostridium perfringens]MDB2049607.1 hypothetical protein [Clostridium perfringens]